MQKNRKPLIIAHRGASALAPENTFAAFQKAIEDGADGIEFDVRLAKDGVPVVFHDSTLNRLAQREGKIITHSFTELQKFDIGSWFNQKNPPFADSKFSEEKIPSFAGLLEFLKDYKGLLYVELKCKQEEISTLVAAVCKIIKQTNLLPQIVLKSFKLRAISLAKVVLPEIYTASLFAPKILNVIHKKRHLLKKAEDCLANEISLHYSLATKKLVKKAANQGLPTTIWTADNPRWVQRAFNLDINAIITNNPARLLAEREIVLHGNSIFS
jgi:glycerophosphoryl diester phosphodiesterase